MSVSKKTVPSHHKEKESKNTTAKKLDDRDARKKKENKQRHARKPHVRAMTRTREQIKIALFVCRRTHARTPEKR